MSATIYKIIFAEKPVQIVMPTLTDIKALLNDNEQLLDLLLLNEIDIVSDNVSIHSKIYETALKNRLVDTTAN